MEFSEFRKGELSSSNPVEDDEEDICRALLKPRALISGRVAISPVIDIVAKSGKSYPIQLAPLDCIRKGKPYSVSWSCRARPAPYLSGSVQEWLEEGEGEEGGVKRSEVGVKRLG